MSLKTLSWDLFFSLKGSCLALHLEFNYFIINPNFDVFLKGFVLSDLARKYTHIISIFGKSCTFTQTNSMRVFSRFSGSLLGFS